MLNNFRPCDVGRGEALLMCRRDSTRAAGSVKYHGFTARGHCNIMQMTSVFETTEGKHGGGLEAHFRVKYTSLRWDEDTWSMTSRLRSPEDLKMSLNLPESTLSWGISAGPETELLCQGSAGTWRYLEPCPLGALLRLDRRGC